MLSFVEIYPTDTSIGQEQMMTSLLLCALEVGGVGLLIYMCNQARVSCGTVVVGGMRQEIPTPDIGGNTCLTFSRSNASAGPISSLSSFTYLTLYSVQRPSRWSMQGEV